jgi:DNA-binding MarR family transcriptional regulator
MSDLSNTQSIEIEPTITHAEVFELIDHAAKTLRRIQRITVNDSGLTPSQYHVLSTLWVEDGQALKDLAEACNCTRATITGLVDGLENKGLIRRDPNPDDRRSLLAVLTPEGRALRSQTEALEAVYQECCPGLAPHEFHQLGLLLTKLNDSFPEFDARRMK